MIVFDYYRYLLLFQLTDDDENDQIMDENQQKFDDDNESVDDEEFMESVSCLDSMIIF
jgi:hypothetical protein